jgi:hypothetical protein
MDPCSVDWGPWLRVLQGPACDGCFAALVGLLVAAGWIWASER